jgi:hypothetical protein
MGSEGGEKPQERDEKMPRVKLWRLGHCFNIAKASLKSRNQTLRYFSRDNSVRRAQGRGRLRGFPWKKKNETQ